MRAVFFGTPALAVSSLQALLEVAEVAGVVTQPDRPAGRGLAEKPPAVKTAALERGLEVYQPLKVRTGELERWVAEREPDVTLVIAYGRILPKEQQTLGLLGTHAELRNGSLHPLPARSFPTFAPKPKRTIRAPRPGSAASSGPAPLRLGRKFPEGESRR